MCMIENKYISCCSDYENFNVGSTTNNVVTRYTWNCSFMYGTLIIYILS